MTFQPYRPATIKLLPYGGAPYGEPLLVTGRVTRNTRLIFESEGAIYLKDGTLAASSHARYMKQPLNVIGDLESNGDIWVCVEEPDDPTEIDIPE